MHALKLIYAQHQEFTPLPLMNMCLRDAVSTLYTVMLHAMHDFRRAFVIYHVESHICMHNMGNCFDDPVQV